MAVIKYKGKTYGASNLPFATENSAGVIAIDNDTIGIRADGTIYVKGMQDDGFATDNINSLFS